LQTSPPPMFLCYVVRVATHVWTVRNTRRPNRDTEKKTRYNKMFVQTSNRMQNISDS
jgi:hypothetical protein